jgi:hypothetical protein
MSAMWQCHYCRLPLSLEVQRRNRLCPNCGSDIHCCKNCTHFDDSISSKCREPNSPWVRDHETQNSCAFFEFKNSSAPARHDTKDDASSEAERAKEAFRALFRNP